MSGSDEAELALAQSTVTPIEPVRFPVHDYAYITELNPSAQGYAQGQLFYDTTGMALGGNWVNPAQSFIAINHTIRASFGSDFKDAVSGAPFTVKNGFPFLHSAVVSIDNKQVNNASPGLSYINNYFYAARWSKAKQSALGALSLFWVDDVTSTVPQLEVLDDHTIVCSNNFWTPSTSFSITLGTDTDTFGSHSSLGDHFLALKNGGGALQDTLSSFGIPIQNKGAWERWRRLTFPGGAPTTGGLGGGGLPPGSNAQPALGTELKSQTDVKIASFWVLYPLEAICDIFGVMGLMRSRIQLTLNLNVLQSCSLKQLAGNGTDQKFWVLKPQTNNGICPIMINALDAAYPAENQGISNLYTSIDGPTYMVLRIVGMSPQQEMSIPPQRTIKWMDFARYPLAPSTTDLQWNITSGVINARKIVMFKSFTAAGMGDPSTDIANANAYQYKKQDGTFTKVSAAAPDRRIYTFQLCGQYPGVAPENQLVCCEPAVSSSGIMFGKNLSVQVGTTPLYQYTIRWTWFTWLQETLTSLYAGGDDNLLIEDLRDLNDYQVAGIEVFDLTKGRLSTQEVNNTQLSISGTIYVPSGYAPADDNGIGVQLQAFVIQERRCVLGRDGRLDILF